MTETKSDATLEVVGERLDLIARLLAYLVAAQHQNLEQRAVALSVLGLSVAEIARVCNTTRNTVSVRLSEARKKPSQSQSEPPRKPRRKG